MDTENKNSLIKIPMQNVFFHDFKFDLTLPDPTPGPKYLYYPFNHESYYKKPKLTNLNYSEKPLIYTRIDLNIPVDEINVKPELYNYDKSRNNTLTEEDEIFFGDKKPRKPSAPIQPLRGSPERYNDIKKSDNPYNKKTLDVEDSEDEEFDLHDSVLSKEEITEHLKRVVNRSFEAASDLKVHNHPTKKGVTATNSFLIVPNFNDIDKKYAAVTFEVSLPTISGKNLLTFEKAKDGVKHISEYLENDDAMKEDGKISAKHNLDYLYFIHDGTTKKKELIERVKYLLMFDSDEKQARFQKIENEVILRKIKPQGPTKRKDAPVARYSVVCRKPFTSEATFKHHLLQRMGENILKKYRIEDTQPDPIVEQPAPRQIRNEIAQQRRPQKRHYDDREMVFGDRYEEEGDEEGEEEDDDFIDDGDQNEGDEEGEEEDDDHSVGAPQEDDEDEEIQMKRPKYKREFLPREEEDDRGHAQPPPASRPKPQPAKGKKNNIRADDDESLDDFLEGDSDS